MENTLTRSLVKPWWWDDDAVTHSPTLTLPRQTFHLIPVIDVYKKKLKKRQVTHHTTAHPPAPLLPLDKKLFSQTMKHTWTSSSVVKKNGQHVGTKEKR